MKTISGEKNFWVIQQIKTSNHQENKKTNKQQTLQESIASSAQFDGQKKFAFDLCNAMISANIPLKKLENTHLKTFLQQYCNRVIPCERLLRKNYMHQIYIKVFEEVKLSIGNEYIWISVDETTDSCGRYIANLLVDVLNKEKATGPLFLILCKELEKTNHETISRFVQEGLTTLFLPNRVPNEKIPLMVTDAAAYIMVKAATTLKFFYQNMIHCTYLAHGLA